MKKTLAILFTASLPLFAHDHAHEHGVGELSITVEGNRLDIDLDVPAESLYFEHEAKIKEDKKIKAAAIKSLKDDASKFFAFDSKLGCVLKKAKVEEDVEPNGHIDLEAEWKYECQKTVGGSEVSIALQTYFSKIKTLRIKVDSDIVKNSLESKGQTITVKL